MSLLSAEIAVSGTHLVRLFFFFFLAPKSSLENLRLMANDVLHDSMKVQFLTWK